MPESEDDFCTDYQADPEVRVRIDNQVSPFYARYNRWERAGANAERSVMAYFFSQVFDAVETALDAGKGQPKGGVLQGDCSKFQSFRKDGPGPYFPALSSDERNILQANGLPLTSANSLGLDRFKALLLLYFTGIDVSDEILRTINGTIFVQVDLKGIAGGGGGRDKRLFVIPGDQLVEFDADLDLGLWRIVDDQITDALDAVRSNTINVTGAVQLRLGDNNLAIYEPIKVGGGGMVIMGRA
ncbi:hypothetical protein [Mesorhizobium sp. 10J20-29]